MLNRRFRLAILAAKPPAPEAVLWLECTIAEAIDRLRRMAVDETLTAATRAHITHRLAQLEPVETDGPVTWQWPK